ncbi:MAG TPA: hypothetical protein VK473_16665 [Terriglobales bacterium]|nr:hypothetical protein [Terriglobales bacterium]
MRTVLLVCLIMVCIFLLSGEARAVRAPYQTALLVEARRVQGGEGVGGDCYLLTIRLRDIVYLAQQCATFYWNSYAPYEFTENGEVEVRLENDKIFLKRPNGKELKARVARRIRIPQNEAEGEQLHSLWRAVAPVRPEPPADATAVPTSWR